MSRENTGPALKQNSLVIGSLLTSAAVVVALVITLGFAARKPPADEAALRAIITGSSSATSVASTQEAQVSPPAAPAVAVPTAPAAPAVAVPTAPVVPPQPTGEAASPQPTSAPSLATPTQVPQSLAPTPLPTMPTPLPTTAEGNNEIRLLSPGWVTVPVGPGVSFELSQPLESIHLPGISALYVNDERTGEVDIFVPVATASGQILQTFDDVVNYLETDQLFSSFEQRPLALWSRLGAVGYRGTGPQLELGFYTDPANVGNSATSWRMPGELEMWIIDTSAGPIVVTAEGIDGDSLAFGRARDLMTLVLETIQIGSG